MSWMSVSVSGDDGHAGQGAVATHILTSIVPDVDPLNRDDLSRFEGEGGAIFRLKDASHIKGNDSGLKLPPSCNRLKLWDKGQELAFLLI